MEDFDSRLSPSLSSSPAGHLAGRLAGHGKCGRAKGRAGRAGRGGRGGGGGQVDKKEEGEENGRKNLPIREFVFIEETGHS